MVRYGFFLYHVMIFISTALFTAAVNNNKVGYVRPQCLLKRMINFPPRKECYVMRSKKTFPNRHKHVYWWVGPLGMTQSVLSELYTEYFQDGFVCSVAWQPPLTGQTKQKNQTRCNCTVKPTETVSPTFGRTGSYSFWSMRGIVNPV